uniref:Neuropeptide-like peptide 36 family protein n=1 Tax=Caenorhabditis tropicalis TaxID=1561998 RepID=A0A1I7UQP9_9PELO
MSVDLKQHLELADYLGALAVWCIFFFILFVLSVLFNFICIKKDDDITALERWGHKKNIGMKLGPHRRSMVARQVPQDVEMD